MKKLSKLVSCVAVLLLVLFLLQHLITVNKDGSYNFLPVNLSTSLSQLVTSTAKENVCKVYYERSGVNFNMKSSTSFNKVGMQDNSSTKTKRDMNTITEAPCNPLKQEDIESVQKFVFFVGYARSGHSIVASLLDAHPNIIMAHEFNLFRAWTEHGGAKLSNKTHLYNKLWANSCNALRGWRSKENSRKGYSLNIASPWLGNFKKLQVIGDKSGAVTTQMYSNSSEKFDKILGRLIKTVNVPIKVIHVVRNPYDIASTRLLYIESAGKSSKLNATTEHKLCSIQHLHKQVNRTITLTTHVHNFLATASLDVLDVHLVDIIEEPGRTLQTLCTFLGVDCSPDYINTCTSKLYKKVARTRDTVIWPEWLMDKIYLEIIKPFPSFWRYSFYGN